MSSIYDLWWSEYFFFLTRMFAYFICSGAVKLCIQLFMMMVNRWVCKTCVNICLHRGRYIISEYHIQYSLPLTEKKYTISSGHCDHHTVSVKGFQINKSKHKRDRKVRNFLFNVCTGLTIHGNYVIVWRSQTLGKTTTWKRHEKKFK